MLNDYPLKFDDEEICAPTSWEESYSVVENVSETEAGTEQVSVTRYGKLSVSAAFQCSSAWLGKLKAYSHHDAISVSAYDAETGDYAVHSMRIRSFKASLVENSQSVGRSNGLWKVSFSLEEF